MIPVARPLMGMEEIEAVERVIASGMLAQGVQVAAFERRFAALCQVREAVAVSSGTAALHLALLAYEIKPGDEVITTAFSFAATATSILLVGAVPVFVDIDPQTYTLDVACVEAAITPRTKAIVPVHLYGHPTDMQPLLQLAANHDLAIIEDACQAHGASIHGKSVGSFGTGCFSFYPTKNMTTGEGGMVTTNDAAIAERVRLLRNHGQQQRYWHIVPGYNLRMTEIQAAIGCVQLEKLQRFTELRIAHAEFLTSHLQDVVQTPIIRPGCRHVYHQYTIRVEQGRDAWAEHLHECGVGTAVHYPHPIYRQPAYQSADIAYRIVNAKGDTVEYLPETEKAAREVLSLPVHPALTEAELLTIVREVRALCH